MARKLQNRPTKILRLVTNHCRLELSDEPGTANITEHTPSGDRKEGHHARILGVGLLLAADDTKQDAVKQEMAQFQGTWKFVSMEN